MDGGIVDQQGPDGAAIAVPFPDSPAARVTSFVAGGGRAVVILCPSRTLRAAVLDGVLAALPSQATRAGNPLASPLTLHRLMFQLGAGAADCDDDGLLARRLDEKTDTSALAVLAVDDAQTLAMDALAALAQVPSPAAGEHPGRLLILAGQPDLLLALFKPGLDALHDPANALLLDLDGLEPAAAPGIEGASGTAHMLSRTRPDMDDAVPVPGTAGPASPEPPDQPGQPVLRRPVWGRLARPVLATLALGAAASVVLALSWDKVPAGPSLSARAGLGLSPLPASPRSLVPAPAQEPPPAQAVVQPFAPAPPIPGTQGAIPVPRPAAMPSDADLRRGFDAFLDRAGRDTAGLSPAARAALFREYLDWRSRSAARPAR